MANSYRYESHTGIMETLLLNPRLVMTFCPLFSKLVRYGTLRDHGRLPAGSSSQLMGLLTAYSAPTTSIMFLFSVKHSAGEVVPLC